MLLAPSNAKAVVPHPGSARRLNAKPLYFTLLGERGAEMGRVDELTGSASRSFLSSKLEEAAKLPVDLPTDPRLLPAWLESAHRQVASDYRKYLDERQAGSPRQFFRNRSHALYFLRAVAPTKLVDGAWLYGAVQRWQDPRLAPLIRIYLEELGDGVAERHHVLLYRRLLARYGCDRWQDQPDGYFVQGAVQLSLAHHANEFLPEVIGFNLGYEQLPLHLLITAYELNELNVDPYYFTLHVTIDNASSGHARKSLQCALDCIPSTGNATEFYRRLANGYRLNEVGIGTAEAIAAFDLERELLSVFSEKAAIGALLHSDYCRIGNRTVSEWLSSPGQLPLFLGTLQSTGWIVRGKEPEQSRFWRLLTDPKAPMFGVFDGYEQQLIRDWIVNDSIAEPVGRAVNRFRQPGRHTAGEPKPEAPPANMPVQAVVAHFLGSNANADQDDDIRLLAEQLAGVDSKAGVLSVLVGLLSPSRHPSPAGLVATRLFSHLFDH